MKTLGLLFIVLAGVAGWWFGTDASFGTVWSLYNPNFEAGTIAIIGPWLWEHAVQPTLTWPVWTVPGVIGVVFLILGMF